MTPDQRLALVEYIAHLCTADWANITKDLQRLGFIPPEVEQDMLDEMSAPIGRILAQLSGGLLLAALAVGCCCSRWLASLYLWLCGQPMLAQLSCEPAWPGVAGGGGLCPAPCPDHPVHCATLARQLHRLHVSLALAPACS